MPSQPKSGLQITGTGIYLPSHVLTNQDLEKLVDTSDEWIFSRTGIRERRIASETETSTWMGVQAAQQALTQAKIQAADLDLILVATVTPDSFFPSAACRISAELGATGCPAFDLQAACSGFVYGMIVAEQFLRTGAARNVLIVGTERLSSVVDWRDRNTCVLFGDGAGAIVLRQNEASRGILAFDWGADGASADLLHLHNPQSRGLATKPPAPLAPDCIVMAGKEIFKQAVNAMADSALRTLQKAGVNLSDVRCVISHQANIRIIDALVDKLKFPRERCFVNVHKYGNMSAACIPVALHEAGPEMKLQKGDKVLLVAFGGGLTWASALLEW
ncbi:MAG: 3-oxoacyl-ACP synthase [Verrucomicrobia subdivision 6 bacterium BACL9 MAG-120507-bin52]|jgi:3-oxoacyl-[acyl-carrier-protein] synthase III|uniref:Beta-ketoacyl-[acyl-carrier-protein] synthase III n=2 Tax=Verrucomicrobia subdivision 6 TaxID=134627 RepID=A0A0R2RJW1_9BACT|nr:MAG: 3-oxoacyl-ACP synthase [Verrucomicrobia subdivision 6 bacterium BACL9 MAG-120507-bin52]